MAGECLLDRRVLRRSLGVEQPGEVERRGIEPRDRHVGQRELALTVEVADETGHREAGAAEVALDRQRAFRERCTVHAPGKCGERRPVEREVAGKAGTATLAGDGKIAREGPVGEFGREVGNRELAGAQRYVQRGRAEVECAEGEGRRLEPHGE